MMDETERELYSIGYEDGQQDKIEGREDAQWNAIPTSRYTNNHRYWDGYGDGWSTRLNKSKQGKEGE